MERFLVTKKFNNGLMAGKELTVLSSVECKVGNSGGGGQLGSLYEVLSCEKATNGAITKLFLSKADQEVVDQILDSVAEHYGISKDDALAEITDQGAESLLDYLNGAVRHAVHVLMSRAGYIV